MTALPPLFADTRFKRRAGRVGLPSSNTVGEQSTAFDPLSADEEDAPGVAPHVDHIAPADPAPTLSALIQQPSAPADVGRVAVLAPGYAIRNKVNVRMASAVGMGPFSLANGYRPSLDQAAEAAEDIHRSDDSSLEEIKKKSKKRKKIGRPQDALAGASRRKNGRMGRQARGPKGKGKSDHHISADYLNRNSTTKASNDPCEQTDKIEHVDFVVCTGHRTEAVLRVARRAENNGRRFYTCANKVKECGFFIWADEVAKTQLSSRAEALRGIECGRPYDVSHLIEATNQPQNLSDAPNLSLDAALQLVSGYHAFRPGQRETLQHIIDGQSCLTILPTGGGKSLCYILAAYLLPGTVLVVSPLLALMKDQQERLPAAVPGACVHSGIQRSTQETIMTDFAVGKLKVLFVAPERLQDRAFLAQVSLPGRISMVCVDEAHCIAEWSHNFRPVYSKLHQILSQTIRPKRVLALTATATLVTQKSICDGLGIPADSIVQGSLCRTNLKLSVSAEKNKIISLLRLFKHEPFNDGAVVVYVSRQAHADTIAHELRSAGLNALAYHARHTHSTREATQNKFISGEVRILVATVAFGMGVDKTNIRGIIHHSLPRSLESYYQEVGRAGRDGLPSACHLFCNPEDVIYNRSQAYSNFVEEQTLQKLMRHLFMGQLPSSDLPENGELPARKLVAIDVVLLEQAFDLHTEVLETALVQLESIITQQTATRDEGTTSVSSFQMYKGVPTRLRIHFDEGKTAKLGSDLLNEILLQGKRRGNTVECGVVEAASALNAVPSRVVDEVENARIAGHLTFECLGTDHLTVVWSGESDFAECARLASVLHDRLGRLQRNIVNKADQVAKVMTEALVIERIEQSQHINNHIQEYFSTEHNEQKTVRGVLNPLNIEFNDAILESDIAQLIEGRQWGSRLRTPLQVTRVLHGHNSPNFQAQDWFLCSHWKRYSFLDFETLKGVVTRVMARART